MLVLVVLVKYDVVRENGFQPTILLFMLCYVLDPIVVLWIVRPYRKAFVAWIRGLKRCKCNVIELEKELTSEEVALQENSVDTKTKITEQLIPDGSVCL